MAGLNRLLRRRLGNDRGAELIELAIVLPILLVVFAAIIDFGFLFQRYEAVTNAAREGARLGSLPGYTAQEVRDRVTAYLDASGMPGAPPASVNLAATQTLPSGTTISPMAEVIVFYHVNLGSLGSIASMVGGGGFGSITLTAKSVMRRESGS